MTCRLAVLVCDRLQTHVYGCVRRSRESVVTVSLTVLDCVFAHVFVLQREARNLRGRGSATGACVL